MNDQPASKRALVAKGTAPSTDGVPVIYADGCRHMGFRHEVLSLTLTADVARPAGERIETIPAIVVHLRMPIETARLLAEYIGKTIAAREAHGLPPQ